MKGGTDRGIKGIRNTVVNEEGRWGGRQAGMPEGSKRGISGGMFGCGMGREGGWGGRGRNSNYRRYEVSPCPGNVHSLYILLNKHRFGPLAS